MKEGSVCLPNGSIYPTDWQPIGQDLEERRIGPKEFEVRWTSEAARTRAIAEFAASLIGRPRVCDHCSRPITPGRFAYLCDSCSIIETDQRELLERIGRIA